MSKEGRSQLVRAAAPLLLATATGCGGEMPVDEGSLETTESPIVNGIELSQSEVVTRGLAALYHKIYDANGSHWSQRPCSSAIIRSSGGVSLVLTARHCVTRNVSYNGTVLQPADVRVLPVASPGLANPDPPFSAIAAANVQAMTPTSGDTASFDMAIVTVNANWSANVAARPAMLVADPSTLTNVSLTSYGYGVEVPNCFDNSSAGVARWGGPFAVTAGTSEGLGGYYWFNNSNAAGHQVICGDSGGPDITPLGLHAPWDHILGVHSGGTGTMFSSAPAAWFQDTVGGLYMSSYWDRNRDAGISFNGPATLLWLFPTSFAGNISRVKYLYSTRQLIATANNKCLNSVAELVNCTGASDQHWDLSSTHPTLVNVATKKCLTHIGTGGTLAMQKCANNGSSTELFLRQQFAFHAQL